MRDPRLDELQAHGGYGRGKPDSDSEGEVGKSESKSEKPTGNIPAWRVKGSKEAKEYMENLRKKRKTG